MTKIIVGVSLVESQTLLDSMHRAATFMAKSMAKPDGVAAWMQSTATAAASAPSAAATGADAASATTTLSVLPAAPSLQAAHFASMESVAYAVMLYFLVSGLLGSYLLTRLFLQRALDNAATARNGA